MSAVVHFLQLMLLCALYLRVHRATVQSQVSIRSFLYPFMYECTINDLFLTVCLIFVAKGLALTSHNPDDDNYLIPRSNTSAETSIGSVERTPSQLITAINPQGVPYTDVVSANYLGKTTFNISSKVLLTVGLLHKNSTAYRSKLGESGLHVRIYILN